MPNEIQAGLIGARDAIVAPRKAALVEAYHAVQHAHGRPIARREHDGVERLRRAITEPHAMRCELLELALQANGAVSNRVDEVKADQSALSDRPPAPVAEELKDRGSLD